MTTQIDAVLHADAIIAAINAAGGHAYLTDDVKRRTAPPEFYTEVFVMARLQENQRVGDLGGIVCARAVTRSVAKTQRNAELERKHTDTALTGKTITVAGEAFGPIHREQPDDPIGDEGDGWWSGTSSWTYA